MQPNNKDIKIGPNQKIIIHWISVLIIIGILISLIDLNLTLSLVLIGFLLLTTGLNKTTYLILSGDLLIIQKKNLLFITTFTEQIDLKAITKMWIKEFPIDESPFRYNP